MQELIPCPTCRKLVTPESREPDGKRHVCGDRGQPLKKSESYPLGAVRDADPLRK